jgi:hypothetical protein
MNPLGVAHLFGRLGFVHSFGVGADSVATMTFYHSYRCCSLLWLSALLYVPCIPAQDAKSILARVATTYRALRSWQQWSAFAIENGRTRLLPVEVGHRNSSEVEITKGLDEDAKVILHPANDLKDGARVILRGN